MNSTTLQIPIDKNIRDQASASATNMGFSSLQEVVRLFLKKLAAREIDVTFESNVVLSSKNDKRYAKMIKDVQSGKVKTETFSDFDKLMDYLSK